MSIEIGQSNYDDQKTLHLALPIFTLLCRASPSASVKRHWPKDFIQMWSPMDGLPFVIPSGMKSHLSYGCTKSHYRVKPQIPSGPPVMDSHLSCPQEWSPICHVAAPNLTQGLNLILLVIFYGWTPICHAPRDGVPFVMWLHQISLND